MEFVVCNCTAQHLHLSNEFGKRSLCLRVGFMCDAAKFSPHARFKFARYAALVKARSLVKISVAIARRPLFFAPFELHAKSLSHRSALKSRNLFQVVIDLRTRALRGCRLQTAYRGLVVHDTGRFDEIQWIKKRLPIFLSRYINGCSVREFHVVANAGMGIHYEIANSASLSLIKKRITHR